MNTTMLPGIGNKQRILFGLVMILGRVACGQSPVIFSVDKPSAAMREVVALHGTDFGTDPGQVSVFFGGVKARIKSISNHMLEVRTPAGATSEPIRVTHTTSGRSAFAPGQFFLNYQGESGITSAKFSAQTDFQAQSGLYDLCLCDFNDDDKVDIATASNTSNTVTIFENTSTTGNVTLAGRDIAVNARTLHVKCGDLNGDGRPDIVLSEASDGSRIFILTNNGNFGFAMQSITLTGIKVKQVGIADLDIDGRPDIVVTNTGGNVLSILPNASSLSSMSFGTPVSISIPGASSTDALSVGDLDGDTWPEIVTSQYQADNENKLFILRNRGSFNFSDIEVIAVNKAVSNIRLADLDADAKTDIVIARLTGSDISVYLNNSSPELSFKDPVFFLTETLPVGMDFSDFDGDGKLDIAVGSIAKSVSVLNNTSAAPGTSSFAPVVKLGTTYINRNLKNTDIDGDGKPDVVFTSVDDFSGIPAPSSKVSVLRNLSCMVPRLTPGGSLDICDGTPLQLKATGGGGITYQWHRAGTPNPLKSGMEDFLDVSTAGEYKVVALSGPPTCSRESNTVTVTFSAPTASLTSENSDARSNSPICSGSALALEVNDVGATEYRWRGPGGFSQSVTETVLRREGFSIGQAGLYIVEMMAGTCIAKTDSTLVESVNIPDFNISLSGGQDFCSGGSRQLAVTPGLNSGFSCQWYESTRGIISGATLDHYTADTSGEYYAVITPANTGCLPVQTPAASLHALTPPIAGSSVPAAACAGVEITLSQQSTVDPAARPVYQWNMGDGHVSSGANPGQIYSGPGSFEVVLEVSYDGVEGCSASVSKIIDVISAVTPQITASALSMCEGESVTLSIPPVFPSIRWNNYETTATIAVDAPGNYSVVTEDENGCASADDITIEPKPAPVLTVSADRHAIAGGQTVQLLASGADAYSWSPGKSLNDSTVANPIASPAESITYIVTGSLIQGCTAMASIAIQVSGEVVNIKVPVLFSPNGDSVNEFLHIDGAENYPDCSLNIFDKRGVRVFGSVGYRNNWDGTVKGTPLSEGVYYYVFGCPDSKVVTGTVTIIR